MGLNDDYTSTEIAEQLDRILSTPAFKNSRILSSFLKFVIGETLAERKGEIKEYTIAVHVLSRNIHFNPQLDAIVRTHSSRNAADKTGDVDEAAKLVRAKYALVGSIQTDGKHLYIADTDFIDSSIIERYE